MGGVVFNETFSDRVLCYHYQPADISSGQSETIPRGNGHAPFTELIMMGELKRILQRQTENVQMFVCKIANT